MSIPNDIILLQTLETQIQELEHMYTMYDFLRLPLDISIKIGDTLTITTADKHTYCGKVIDLQPNQTINSVYIKLERIKDATESTA